MADCSIGLVKATHCQGLARSITSSSSGGGTAAGCSAVGLGARVGTAVLEASWAAMVGATVASFFPLEQAANKMLKMSNVNRIIFFKVPYFLLSNDLRFRIINLYIKKFIWTRHGIHQDFVS